MDTIRFTERRADRGVFFEAQAKRLAASLADHMRDELATKRDPDLLRRDIGSDIDSLRTEIGLLRRDPDAALIAASQRLEAAETRLDRHRSSAPPPPLVSFRNQLLASHLASFIGIILYFRLGL